MTNCTKNKQRQGPFLNMTTCLYLRSCVLVTRHQSLPKYESNPQVHVWPSRNQIPGCELAPPRSSHFSEDASEMTCADFSRQITQDTLRCITAAQIGGGNAPVCQPPNKPHKKKKHHSRKKLSILLRIISYAEHCIYSIVGLFTIKTNDRLFVKYTVYIYILSIYLYRCIHIK